MLCVLTHRLALDDGLGVVVIVLELEDIRKRAVGRHFTQLLENCRAVLRQSLLNFARAHCRHVGVPAVGQELRGVLKGGGIQHTLRLLIAQEPRLPRAKHGGYAEIRFFFI